MERGGGADRDGEDAANGRHSLNALGLRPAYIVISMWPLVTSLSCESIVSPIG